MENEEKTMKRRHACTPAQLFDERQETRAASLRMTTGIN